MVSSTPLSMKNLIRLTAIFLIMSFAMSGCYYDKENELYPYTACGDTTNVTYSQSIAHVADVPDLIHCGKEFNDAWMDIAMGVGEDAYLDHGSGRA